MNQESIRVPVTAWMGWDNEQMVKVFDGVIETHPDQQAEEFSLQLLVGRARSDSEISLPLIFPSP